MIADIADLETHLSEPTPGAIEALARTPGDLILLGAGGKMGPTLARMARRASDAAGTRRRIFAVARFSDDALVAQLESQGIEPIRCDLLAADQLARLPDVPNVVFMTGMKFGSTGQEALTWAMNAWLPGLICQKYRRSRIVAFSTGNVYGLSPVHLCGSRESDPLAPVGEYSLSAVGRERIFEHFSHTLDLPLILLRLNYATELRYGVLVDIARKVWAGEEVPLAMGHVNVLWQGDANAQALASLPLATVPPRVVNLAGAETLSVRRVAEEFGRLLDRPVHLSGIEAPEALLSNSQQAGRLFGYPRVGPLQMMEWIADWVRRGGACLSKPTHFEQRDGKF